MFYAIRDCLQDNPLNASYREHKIEMVQNIRSQAYLCENISNLLTNNFSTLVEFYRVDIG